MSRDADVFPIFLKLSGRPVLVVGGGVVATGKVDALVQSGARVTVVAPAVSERIRRSGVTIRQRPFEPADVDGQWLVVAAAPPEVNRAVAEHAHARGTFVNAVDDPANASAYLGGVVRRQGVTIAISTNGRAPAIAGLLREGVDAVLPDDLDRWIGRSDELKRVWRAGGVPMEARRPQMLDALVALYADRAAGDAESADDGTRAAGVGCVSLVGAGPGDPELLTLRAVRRLKSADVIFHDGLVPPAVLALAPQARQVSVARRTGPKALSQDDVNKMMTAAARNGQRVVRLKSGDPFVFGRGGEEVRALAEAGVQVEVVPGVTTALGAPTLAGIPVTHRGIASGFLVVSGHDRDVYGPLLAAVVPGTITLVVLMGMAERAGIQAALVDAGWRLDTPVAIVMNASRPDEHKWFGTLADLADGRGMTPFAGAGVIVIGSVVALAGTATPAATFESEERTWQPTTIPRR